MLASGAHENLQKVLILKAGKQGRTLFYRLCCTFSSQLDLLVAVDGDNQNQQGIKQERERERERATERERGKENTRGCTCTDESSRSEVDGGQSGSVIELTNI